MSVRIAEQVKYLGLEDAGVVVGGGVMEAVGLRPANDIDISVDFTTFRNLRDRYDWETHTFPDGKMALRGNNFDISFDWRQLNHHELAQHANTIEGVKFASLSDVYAWKQDLGRPKDQADLLQIRQRLFGRPMPEVFLHRELGFVQSLLPEHLHDHPAAKVAANGLFIVRTLYGHVDAGNTRQFTGAIETQPVLALAHDYEHTASGMRRLPEHIRKANARHYQLTGELLFRDSDLLAALAGYAYHDGKLGDGREADNPDNYDELQSSYMVENHLTIAGAIQDDIPKKGFATARATAFDQRTRGQDVNPARGYEHLQVCGAGTDLGSFVEADAVFSAMKFSIEDGFRVVAGRSFDWKLASLVTCPGTLAEALAMIDSEPQLVDAFAASLLGSANFMRNHRYPRGWTLDNPERRFKHAAVLVDIGERIKARQLTVTAAAKLALSLAVA